jgi:hypothetical protein
MYLSYNIDQIHHESKKLIVFYKKYRGSNIYGNLMWDDFDFCVYNCRD